jgi:hypothetical protein
MVDAGDEEDAWGYLKAASANRAKQIRAKIASASKAIRNDFYRWKSADDIELRKVFEEAYAQVAERIVNSGDLAANARQRALLKDLEGVLRGTARDVQSYTAAAVSTSVDYGHREVWSALAGNVDGSIADLYGPGSSMWGKVNTDATAAVLSAERSIWSRRIWKHEQNALDGIAHNLAVGVAQGRSTDEIVRSVRGYLLETDRTDAWAKGLRTKAQDARDEARAAAKQAESYWRRAKLAAERNADQQHIEQMKKLAQGWEARAEKYHATATRLYRSAAASEVVPEKGLYRSWRMNARRMVREETNRAYQEGYLQGAKQYGSFVLQQWTLSAGHPKPDICDYYASRDTGNGPGVYKVNDYPAIPHIGCFCYPTPVVQWDNVFPDSSEES